MKQEVAENKSEKKCVVSCKMEGVRQDGSREEEYKIEKMRKVTA